MKHSYFDPSYFGRLNFHRYLVLVTCCALFAVISGFSTLENDQPHTDRYFDAQEIWHIKALDPNGRTLDVKAYDAEGVQYDVKAVSDPEQGYIMEVRVIKENETIPLKVLVSEKQYKPVVGIDTKGKLYEVYALAGEQRIPVKGIRMSGYIVHIKAIDQGRILGVKAISVSGKLKDVKGVKMYDKQLEATLHGNSVHAHVLALPQITN